MHACMRACTLVLRQTHGTSVDRKALVPHKPANLKDGAQIKFGTLPNTYVLHCENSEFNALDSVDHATCLPCAAEKRRAEKSGPMVRASHLLVKHKDSRRPSSWKVGCIEIQAWDGFCMGLITTAVTADVHPYKCSGTVSINPCTLDIAGTILSVPCTFCKCTVCCMDALSLHIACGEGRAPG
eukprot:52082-Chlamydomonas_euryale.AAC.6